MSEQSPGGCRKTSVAVRILLALGLALGVSAKAAETLKSSATNITVVEIEGVVEVLRFGAQRWDPIKVNSTLDPGDQLQTGPRSRAAVRWTDLTVKRLDEHSLLQVPREPRRRTGFNLLRGALYFFHRDRPGEFDVQTPTVSAVVRGTEFNLKVAEDGTTTFTMFDGSVELTNAFGTNVVEREQQAVVEPGKPPVKTALLASARNDVIQWCLHYPAVLDPDELPLTADELNVLRDSLAHYRSGDVLRALSAYPDPRTPASEAESVYLAALVLAVGRVEEAEQLLARIKRTSGDDRAARAAEALRKVIAAVKFRSVPSTLLPDGSPDKAQRARILATEWLAESYSQQSRFQLVFALQAAQEAVNQSPDFGLAWARLAELQFSFGQLRPTRQSLDRALQLSPNHAPALSTRGFIHAASNRSDEALTHFERAIALNGSLGHAWLGRGLVRIRQGHAEAGRQDLLMAAASLPPRQGGASAPQSGHDWSLARSYLGKAFGLAGDFDRAEREMNLAKQLDPADPTPWLYSALILQDRRQINAAMAEIERSIQLNDNRRIFRSRLLLDRDRAVRGANLASIYRDAGMVDVSVREAARAVADDYGNFSAHLFLANSYAELRDPRQINLRYETPWFNELLLANLLAPVGGGSLSQNISQQEYARLFERDRLGVSSFTEYSSRGDWLQAGSQYGNFGNTGYSLDAIHLSQNGQRPNEDIDQTTLWGKFKQQLSPQDALLIQMLWYENESGDVRQYYDPAEAHGRLRFTEKQEPTVLVGYHHEWAPGSHTLLLAGHLDDQVTAHDPEARLLTVARNADGSIRRVRDFDFSQSYRSDFTAYSTELQDIWATAPQTLIAGARYQIGQADTVSEISRDPTLFPANLLTHSVVQANSTDLERLSIYAYEHWRVVDPLQVSVGLSYDRLRFPANIDHPPIADGEESRDQLSPKIGFRWTPTPATTLRGAYTRSLGGVYYDSSVRLEPSQLAGFLQSFRSAIPESVAGPVAGSEFETGGLALDLKFPTRTHVSLAGEILRSDADRSVGVFDLPGSSGIPATTREGLAFTERTLTVTVNQLFGDGWAMGAAYRLSDAELETDFRELPVSAFAAADSTIAADLQQLVLFALMNHPSGCFARAEALWNVQSNRGYLVDRPGDDFWQFNSYVGYRFLRRRAEIRVGLLNLTDRNYRLNPLNLHAELPRERTLTVSLKFDF